MKLTISWIVLAIAFGVSVFAQSPQLFSNDGQGKYLGNLSANRFDPNSVSNPFGMYGSPFSPNSINNPFGMYGSPFSPYSAHNPFTMSAPIIQVPSFSSFGVFAPPPEPYLQPLGGFGQY